jgi:serine phosphatase RsbU (regulator of sigma subunit)
VAITAQRTFYLASDGLFDQSGGEKGYGFGVERFKAALASARHQGVVAQRATVAAALRAYQGDYPQRDDITVLGFQAPFPVE